MKITKRVEEIQASNVFRNFKKANNFKMATDQKYNSTCFSPFQIIFQKIGLSCLLFLPFLTFSQLPELGTTRDFAVFTSVGALGNTGISSISGDVGTNDGAITGFDAPTAVIGVIESENATTAQCLLDVQDL